MMYEKERERKFQYELTKIQVDFEFGFTVIIGMLAILYGLLSFYEDNPLGSWLTIASIGVTVVFLYILLKLKEKKFKDLRKKYIESYWD